MTIVVHTKRARQELIHEARTSGFEVREETQQALPGEWKRKMKVQGGQKEVSNKFSDKKP
jgi:hypothetical protein